MFAAQGALQGHRALPYRKHFSLEAYIENYVGMLREHIKLPLTLRTIKDIHASLFTQPFNLYDKNFFYRITNPAIKDTRINLMCRKSSIFRDTHIVRYIETLLRAGKNVFVVFGSTHALMQEKTIRALIV